MNYYGVGGKRRKRTKKKRKERKLRWADARETIGTQDADAAGERKREVGQGERAPTWRRSYKKEGRRWARTDAGNPRRRPRSAVPAGRYTSAGKSGSGRRAFTAGRYAPADDKTGRRLRPRTTTKEEARARGRERGLLSAANGSMSAIVVDSLLSGARARRLWRNGDVEGAKKAADKTRKARMRRVAKRVVVFNPQGGPEAFCPAIDELLERYLRECLADSSQGRAATVWTWWLTFIAVTEEWGQSHGSAVAILDMTAGERDLELCRFSTFLSMQKATWKKRKDRGAKRILPSTVSTYVSALVGTFKKAVGKDVRDGCPMISGVHFGMRRLGVEKSVPRLHISVRMLLDAIAAALGRASLVGIMLACMFSFAFLFMLRVGEYTVTRGYPDLDEYRHLTFDSLTCELAGAGGRRLGSPEPGRMRALLLRHKILVVSIDLGKTKTCPDATGVCLSVWAVPGSAGCLCKRLRHYLLALLDAGIDPRGRALFAHRDGTPVSDVWFRKEMRACFKDVRGDDGEPLPPELTIPHALRAAGCTALMLAGAKQLIIKVFGRWRFDSAISYSRYIALAFIDISKGMLRL